MTAYRLFFFDAAEHIRGWVLLDCGDDGEAVREATGKADGRAMELWNLDRLVCRFPVDPVPKPQPPLTTPG